MQTLITLRIHHIKPLRKDFTDTVRNRVSTMSDVESVDYVESMDLAVLDMELVKELKEMK